MVSDMPFQTNLDPATCVKKGLCFVSKNPPRRLYYEVHGSLQASQKMLLIMGLNGPSGAWSSQVDHFAKKPDHAVLVFDNRGVGNSDCGPLERYKTSEMALDALELLNFLGWEQERSLHVFGVSMGGMITQELCRLVPKRIKSVSFISTTCGQFVEVPCFKAISMSVQVASGRTTREQEANLILGVLFPKAYLNSGSNSGKTHRDEMLECYLSWYNNPCKQSPNGKFGQLTAAMSHCLSQRDLDHLGKEIWPAKILVTAGDQDETICPVRSLELSQQLPGSELVMFKGAGHALGHQVTEEFNALMERVMDEGNEVFDYENRVACTPRQWPSANPMNPDFS